MSIFLLNNIKFPIFAIGSYNKLWSENNILYLSSTSDIIYKVDNKNLPYDSLAKRRSKIAKKERYNFIGTYFTFEQLVKSGKHKFIDSTGYVFNYKKTTKVNLIYKKIISVKQIEGKGFLLFVKGITRPFLVSAFVYNMEKYIGLLSVSGDYLLYELSEEKKPNTWRKI